MRKTLLSLMVAAGMPVWLSMPCLAQDDTIVGADELRPITHTPAGRTQLYNNDAHGFDNVQYRGGFAIEYDYREVPTEVVWCDNGEVYIKNPVSAYPTNSYIVGIVDGDELVVRLPQCLEYIENSDGTVTTTYLNILYHKYYDTTGVHYFLRTADEENNVIRYKIGEDNSLSFSFVAGEEPESGKEAGDYSPFIMGLTKNNEPDRPTGSMNIGDCQQTMRPFYTEVTKMPDGLELEPANVKYGVVPTKWENYLSVNVAYDLDGEYVYISNLNPDTPEACLKGKIEGEEIVFPMGQYMGVNKEMNTFCYLYICTNFRLNHSELGWLVAYDIETLPELRMKYDPLTGEISSPDAHSLVFSCFPDRNLINKAYDDPVFYTIDPTLINERPENPRWYQFQPFNTGLQYGFWSVTIPNVNRNGVALSTSSMYYRLYVDDELYTFDPIEYPRLNDMMIDIPYNFTDNYGILNDGSQHTIYYFFDGATSVGVESYFIGTDDNKYWSDRAVFYPETMETAVIPWKPETEGVDELHGTAETAYSYYTNAQGIRVSNPEGKGMYIRTDVLTDGSHRSRKIILKK